jgi:hypothetical protein
VKRNLPSLILLALLSFLCLVSCKKSERQDVAATDSVAVEPTFNALSTSEKEAGWELLFDGSTLNGWKRYGADSIGPLWSVKDGMIVCDGTGLGEGSGPMGGSLMTLKQYGNFELTADWKISPGGNSGILYHVVEKPEYKHDYDTGPEYQVMDDTGWKDPLRDEQKAGGSYDMYPASANKKLMPVGEWNSSKIIYNNGHVEHWLNGEKVLEFQEGDADYQARYKKSKWVDYPGWNKSKTGSISLQDHGAPVYYRNIKIRAL